MITNQQIAACKQALLQRQSELISLIQNHLGLTLESVQQSTGELSNYDNHPADTGSELFERSKDVALNEHAEKELEAINKALHAIEEGTYGICRECGGDIPYERLTAIPTADRCMQHAIKNSFNQYRTIEEKVFSPNINPDEVTEEVQVGYDAEDAWQEVSAYGTSESASDFFGDKKSYYEMYPNSKEAVGSVEDVEAFLAADLHGKYIEPAPNHKDYEESSD
ncbi:TraR/DksA C4-type zinc finger protein [Virgibacillus proomii]|jgi:YteA family regulatory protein|uniref:TraR/DksA C4-type zinc finger protein n=1 Tax=Virgibacillus proomii TaxID=84407 RepID=UPI0009844F96|nr:TraR/DksA C4-type zinc finger protein [Virgibacillus proomii]